MEQELQLKKKLGLWTAILAVFASMIGSGIFGTSGEILKLINSPLLTVALWLFYGLVALAGALSYSELAAMMQVFFILASFYLMVFSFIENWKNCVPAIAIVLGGIPIYYIWQCYQNLNTGNSPGKEKR